MDENPRIQSLDSPVVLPLLQWSNAPDGRLQFADRRADPVGRRTELREKSQSNSHEKEEAQMTNENLSWNGRTAQNRLSLE
jgi:hypothetical protein